MIVSEREQQAWYQPWTFVRPWVRGFIGYSPSETVETAEGSGIYVVQLRGQERWQPQVHTAQPSSIARAAGAPRSCRTRGSPETRRACGRHMARGAGRRPDPERRLAVEEPRPAEEPHPSGVLRDRRTGPRPKGQGGGPATCSRHSRCVCAYSCSSPFSPAPPRGLAIAGLVLGYVRLGEDHALSAFVIAGAIRRSGDLRADHLGLGSCSTRTSPNRWSVWPPRLRARASCRSQRRDRPTCAGQVSGRSGHCGGAAVASEPDRDAATPWHSRWVGKPRDWPARRHALRRLLLRSAGRCSVLLTVATRSPLYNGHAREILGSSEAFGLNRPLRGLLRHGAPSCKAYERPVDQGQWHG